MNAILNRNDIDNLRLAIDKMKGVDFDAARKMELLLEAYEKQSEDDTEAAKFREAIEDLPGYRGSGSHLGHLRDTAEMLNRALDNVQEWRDSKDDEPLDDAVKRLVEKVNSHASEVSEMKDKLADVFNDMIAIIDQEPKELITIRNLAAKTLEFLGD